MDQIEQFKIKCSNHAQKQATHLFVSSPYLFKVLFTCDICTISSEYQDYSKFALSEILEDKKETIIKDLPYLTDPKTLKSFSEKVEQLQSYSKRQKCYQYAENLIDSYINNLIDEMQQIKKIFLSKYDLLEASEFYDFYFEITKRQTLKNMILSSEVHIDFQISNFFYDLFYNKTKNQKLFEEKLEILKQIQNKKDVTPLKQELEIILNGIKALVQKLKGEIQPDNCSQNGVQHENQNNQINLEKVELNLERDEYQQQMINQNLKHQALEIAQENQNKIIINDVDEKVNIIINKYKNLDNNEHNFQIENKLNVLNIQIEEGSNNYNIAQPIQFQQNIYLENPFDQQKIQKPQEQNFLGKFKQLDNYIIKSQLQEGETQIGAIDSIGMVSQDLVQNPNNKFGFLEDCKYQNLISNNGLCAIRDFSFVEFNFESNQVIEITFEQNEIVFYNTSTNQRYSQKFLNPQKKCYHLGFVLSGQSELQII
ncbi:hypothetical protein ABPG74_014064 [Tetrahymena malaccensis]